jgi:GxxExxY protein
MNSAAIIQIAEKIMEDLGAGYSESIYQNALHRKLLRVDDSSCMEKIIPVVYDGDTLGICRADIVTVSHVVEVKAVKKMPSGACKQVSKYVKHLEEADGLRRIGLVVNFNQETEKVEAIEYNADAATDEFVANNAKRRKFVPVND